VARGGCFLPKRWNNGAVTRFCFITHPLSRADVERYEPGSAGKGDAIIAKILSWMPSYAAAHVTGIRTPDGRTTEGWFVMLPLLPAQLLALPREEAYRRINEAIAIGADLGAEIAGLGAFTAVIGDGGVTVAERSPIPVTTGNALTIATAVRSLFRAAAEMDIDPAGATAVVVGATGSIGSACVELLAPHVRTIVCVARNETRLRKFVAATAPLVACDLRAATDLHAAVREADLVLTATSSVEDVIFPADLRSGSVVCEVSLPHDVSRRVAAERPDVLVIEGGNLHVPGAFAMERVREPGMPFDLGLPPGDALACMSETMVLALEGRRESYTLGRGIDLAKVREIDALAERAGFTLAGMRAFDTGVTPERIAATRAARAEPATLRT
jgi:predicted amino acid dehydrogenase